uniref:Uncharacterized protein n=1 Tax=viral metagenome TaxID=1070528 RepID=A0A6C0BZ62_9ZZZZ
MSRRRETTLSYSDEYLAAQRAAEMRPGHPMQKLRTRDVEEIMRQHARIGETGVALSLGKAGSRRRTHRLNMHRKPKKKSRNRRRSNRRRSNRRRSNRRRSNRRRSNRRRSNRRRSNRRRQKKKKTRSN